MITKNQRHSEIYIGNLFIVEGRSIKIQVAQTRLEKRSHRTENENCNDSPHIKIVEEVLINDDNDDNDDNEDHDNR